MIYAPGLAFISCSWERHTRTHAHCRGLISRCTTAISATLSLIPRTLTSFSCMWRLLLSTNTSSSTLVYVWCKLLLFVEMRPELLATCWADGCIFTMKYRQLIEGKRLSPSLYPVHFDNTDRQRETDRWIEYRLRIHCLLHIATNRRNTAMSVL